MDGTIVVGEYFIGGEKKCPLAKLLAFGALRYVVLLCTTSIISLALYVVIVSPWVAAKQINCFVFFNVCCVGVICSAVMVLSAVNMVL